MSTTQSYIPRSVLFEPAETMAIKISPDGKFLAYVNSDKTGVMNIHVCPTEKHQDKNSFKQLTFFKTPEIYRFFWMGDSKHLICLHDTNGSKAYQLYSIDIDSGRIKNNTEQYPQISAKIYKISNTQVAIGINDRNADYHDVYILDMADDSLTKVYENDKYSRFTFNEQLEIIFKEEVHDDGSIDIYKDNELYFQITPEDAFHTKILHVYNNTLYYLDTRNSDTTVLKSRDLKTNEESSLAHHSQSDINDIVFVNGKPFMYATMWLTKEWRSFGEENLDFLQQQLGTNFQIISQSGNHWIIRAYDPKRIRFSFYLYNREAEQLTPLYLAKTHPKLANTIPFEFESRDGLTITAYLTLPHPLNAIADLEEPLPLVVLPHGGPFQARDSLTYNAYAQWLASRGYATLTVNFRSSSGFGKKFVNAGNGEWGRKALFDVIDGVHWCIDAGVTRKDIVGIMGGSYGGYQTLAGLAFTPEEFAVGVDLVGPSSLITVMQKVPNYWDFPSYPLSDSELFFTRGAFIKSMGGTPDTEAGRNFLASRSPLHFANQIIKPLLLVQGDNDPIVTKNESQQIFDELKRLQKQTLMLSFSDEGHQFQRYANIDVYLAYAEKWLHDVLGGDFELIDEKLLKESSVKIQN